MVVELGAVVEDQFHIVTADDHAATPPQGSDA